MSDSGYEPTQVNLPPVQPGDTGQPPGGPGEPPPPPPTPPGGQPPVGGPPPTDEPPPEEPRDWRPWIIGGLIALIVLIILALLLLGDDDGDDETADTTTSSTTTSSTTTSTTSTSTSTTTSTTAAPATTTTTEAPPVTVDPAVCAADGTDPDDPETPAQTVMDAWFRGDELCAAELMTPAARNDLFSRDPGDTDEEFQGCFEVEEPDPAFDCAFTHPGGSTHFLMNFSETDGWLVFDVFQVAD
jgi:hypothetical protein